MKCDKCKYAPSPYPDGDCDECPHWEKHGVTWKDGSEGCTLHWKTLEKMANDYDEAFELMAVDMSLDLIFHDNDWDMSKTIKQCEHMIGMDKRDIYHRHGKAFYKAYRNRWGNGDNPKKDFDELVNCGLMRRYTTGQGNIGYCLTNFGLKWLGQKIGVTIKEDD